MPRPNTPEIDLFERGVLVRLSGVNAGYGAATVLVGLEFESRAGEVALVTGPAAAGKTTFMHLLRLALEPRSGRAVILGQDVGRARARTRAAVKRRIGYVAENPVFIEQWTAFDNIAMPLRMLGKKPREYADDVRELVDFVGLNDAADLTIEKLSGAERHRAAIARALAAKPDLILADDPTAGMSPADGRRIVRLLAEMRRVGAGVVIASQDDSLADCAPLNHWRMDRGRLTPAFGVPAQAEAME
ncbi:ATP-binding cassette domain-containing protein [Terricaulis silvestris]|uniref:Cell division ATP-binding protein FtsE n=1 Tax=Terricaulis silvestris TaxID=2686094 RepID=A0A6I6MRM9_9CAUL|nr:ATP-binding cassette domain-containing protein [Terricaulis silvestris]QGZ96048.1 Cell division ATP-binding protein FtsE [Terricaulis silvestris]